MKQIFQSKSTSAILIGIISILIVLTDCKKFEPERIDPDDLYTLTINSVSNVTYNSCTLNGELVTMSGQNITQHGFCWSESHNPTIENSDKNELGSRTSTGSFSSTISNLSTITTYYVKAYVTDKYAGTAYGEEKYFTTNSLSVPTITTSPISSITESSAQSGGEVTTDGGSIVTARGVCWSTSQSPTVSNSKTTNGNGLGTFSSSITGLTCGTTYYVRAYATNSSGTGYGDNVSFITSECVAKSLPTVTTSYLSNITNTSAEGGGEITDDGGGSITARGVCWGTSENPTILDFTTDDGTGEGIFISNISGLIKSTTYHVRAYATNSIGISYGEDVILRTYEGIITDYDGNEYWTVIIGDQKWMAENLNVSKYANGVAIPLVEEDIMWEALTETDQAYAWYDNNPSNGNSYGALYTWSAAMAGAGSSDLNPSNIQGACPSGWHLPSDEEWKQLELFLGMNPSDVNNQGNRGTNEGGKLKEVGLVHWFEFNTGATDESGFTAFPGGYRNAFDAEFNDLGQIGYYLCSTESSESMAIQRGLSYINTQIYRGNHWKNEGLSVRCVEGQGNSVPTVTTSEPSKITENSADAGGNVTDDGGQTVIEKGVCYSTDPNPTIDDEITSDGSGTGSFSSSIAGLSPYTTYYIRAYATNSVGTGYGEIDSLKTRWDNSTITDYNGNVYNTVQIGEQIWMQENMKATHYSDGSAIPFINTINDWKELDSLAKAYCWYDDIASNGETYGALYTWTAAVNGTTNSDNIPSGVQGVCTVGWHIPSNSEWKKLEMFLGMSQEDANIINLIERGSDEGAKLKESGFNHWRNPNSGATNESGFTGLPGGVRNPHGGFASLTGEGTWFSSTLNLGLFPLARNVGFDHSKVYNIAHAIRFGMSVRCVKDE